jgi:hypothetical protein
MCSVGWGEFTHFPCALPSSGTGFIIIPWPDIVLRLLAPYRNFNVRGIEFNCIIPVGIVYTSRLLELAVLRPSVVVLNGIRSTALKVQKLKLK